jgi:hypothetical protein
VRARLRPAHPPEDLASIYRVPHRHSGWIDHRMRVTFSAMLANAILLDVKTGADLSCGDGALLGAIPLQTRIFGDLASGWPITGPIEQTIDQIPDVDLLVCAETIEHLDDPDLVLKKARAKASRLLLSTPIEAWEDDNPEHYWAWDRAEVDGMLAAAGFSVTVFLALDLRPAQGDYCFGIWACT